MKVSAEAAAPGVDRALVDKQFAEIYELHFARLVRHIYFSNRLDLTSLAEDFAQDTFMSLYRDLLNGLEVSRPYGLLCCKSRTVVAQYLTLRKNTEFRAVDLGNPVNTPIIATGHAYAVEVPELASLACELDHAMAAMESASLAWRSAHHAKGRYRHLLASDEQGTQELTDAGRDRTLRKLAEAEAVEPATLARFQEACHRVGALRAELERAGGANYRSSSGMPASAASSGSGREGSVTSDLSVTHCPEGHALVLDNLNFTAQGQRRCRSCMTQSAIRGQEKRGVRKNSRPQSGTGRGPVPAEVIDKARQMLTDPANRMSIKKIGEAVGVSSSVLYARAADAIAARRAILATREQPALVSA